MQNFISNWAPDILSGEMSRGHKILLWTGT
jgi:hypothetical protein